MNTKAQKVRSVLTLSVSEKTKWIEQFEKKGSFPNKEVPCSSCNEGITMFGTNLKNRVERYESVEEFLNTFVCRTCKGKIKKGETIAKQETKAIASEEDTIIEDSYVVEPDDDSVEITAQNEDEEEVTVEEDEVQVFDDSDEIESDSSNSDDEVTEPLDIEAMREKYKAFYAMKRS